MQIKSIYINNFKSLIDFKLDTPNPFSVFVGANGVGKRNIFEALEFLNFTSPPAFKISASGNLMDSQKTQDFVGGYKIEDLFGGYKNFINFNGYKNGLTIEIKSEHSRFGFNRNPYETDSKSEIPGFGGAIPLKTPYNETVPVILEFEQIAENFSRIFINASEKKKLNITSDNKLNLDSSNLEKVLKRLLSAVNIREEIKDWLRLFIPAFKNIEINSDELSGTDTLLFYEKNSDKPFTKNLISDGTYNILCLLTAIYQSDTPQFICIEEPENGLNPYVIKELVTFFREQCKEKGHYIWLNTHSQTLVNQLKPEEIIVVNKENGNTIAKQFIGKDMHGMAMDTAWLTNFFGGGVPW